MCNELISLSLSLSLSLALEKKKSNRKYYHLEFFTGIAVLASYCDITLPVVKELMVHSRKIV